MGEAQTDPTITRDIETVFLSEDLYLHVTRITKPKISSTQPIDWLNHCANYKQNTYFRHATST